MVLLELREVVVKEVYRCGLFVNGELGRCFGIKMIVIY